MNDFKVKTIDQLHDAMESIESAREDSSLSKTDRQKLEEAYVQLRNIERSIIRQKEKELADVLTSNAKALNNLADQIKASSDKLDAVGNVLKNAAKVVQAFINIITTASAAGLL